MVRIKDILTYNERKILSFLLFALFLGILVKYIIIQNEPAFSGEIDSVGVYDKKIDIRTASSDELQQLPRIGEVMAERILAYRQQKQFECTDELQEVKGIGHKTMERILPYLLIFGKTVAVAVPVVEDTLLESGLIDVNHADLEELMTLPGIGKVKAQRIIDRREAKGNFRTLEELLEVNGIGEKTLAKLKPLIKCER
jgi:competence protein ComEA